jgi:hypothetical protein
MRPLRLLLITLVAALAVLAVPAAAGASNHHRPCAAHRHWVIAAQDSFAVVARLPDRGGATYDYCSRTKGRWVRMTPGQSSPDYGEVEALRLAGRYVAYETVAAIATPAFLCDTSTGQQQVEAKYRVVDASAGPNENFPASDPDFLLSPTGVVARIDKGLLAYPPGAVEALTLDGSVTLDTAGAPSDLANLQIYNCAAGCARNATVVAWTNSGVQRYAEVTGGG